jgi:hypothetical protein
VLVGVVVVRFGVVGVLPACGVEVVWVADVRVPAACFGFAVVFLGVVEVRDEVERVDVVVPALVVGELVEVDAPE